MRYIIVQICALIILYFLEEEETMGSDDLMAVAAVGAISAGYIVFALALIVVSLIGMWKVFIKAGKPGWAAIVPFYNAYCLFDIAFEGKGWMFILCFVPCVGTVVLFILWFKLAEVFGKGPLFGVGLLLFNFIFMMILGFGDAQYIGDPNRDN